MYESADEIVMLLKKSVKDELSADEKLRLESWANESEQNRRFYDEMTDENAFTKSLQEFYNVVGADRKERISSKAATVVDIYARKTQWRFYVAAASVFFVLMLAAFLFYYSDNKQDVAKNTTTVNPVPTEIPPAGDKAILTLSDGREISLSDANNGVLAKDGKMVINKKEDGELVYELNPSDKSAQHLAFNTISTPRGGKYQVMLPDGSKVWINAATTLRFPVVFTGNERAVELTGEAYFEVAKDKSKPFKVVLDKGGAYPPLAGDKGGGLDQRGRLLIEVLGTQFNVNAYDEEPEINATLLEGRIKFTTRDNTLKPVSKVLTPGQRATVSKNGNDLVVSTAKEPEASIAWVNGQFAFEKTNLKAVMRELSRWYDVQVTFDDDVAMNTLFTGKVDRMIPLTRLLSNLEKIGDVRFIVAGRTVKVSAQR